MRITTNDFNLSATLESGQVFGFNKRGEACFEGAIDGKRVVLDQNDGVLVARCNEQKLSQESIRTYFDLDRDLSSVYRILTSEAPLARTHDLFKGLRLIRQNGWEALACFIISSNNNVKRIQGIWKRLAEHLRGDPFLFPSANQIAESSEEALRGLGLGYRAPYLLKTARLVTSNPDQLVKIQRSKYEVARTLLLAYPGIGTKVADCALLYGFQKYEAFPVDVWIGRAMRKLYFRNRKVSEQKIQQFAQKRWGAHAGYVQQYLFHGARLGLL